MNLYDVRGKVIYEDEEVKTTKELVEKANLSWTNLSRASLSWTDLTGANLTGANLTGANLSRAYLTGADLSWTDLTGTDLTGADLTRANLTWVNLTGADLSEVNLMGAYLTGVNLAGANLSRANLTGANLTRANGIPPHACTPLLMLLDQPGPIRAYKLVNSNMEGPYKGGIKYTIGEKPEVENANTDPNKHCATGINLATLDWCLKEWKRGYRVMICEFTADDIACIPTATDGKFRVHRCSVVGEKDLTGLIPEENDEEVPNDC